MRLKINPENFYENEMNVPDGLMFFYDKIVFFLVFFIAWVLVNFVEVGILLMFYYTILCAL